MSVLPWPRRRSRRERRGPAADQSVAIRTTRAFIVRSPGVVSTSTILPTRRKEASAAVFCCQGFCVIHFRYFVASPSWMVTVSSCLVLTTRTFPSIDTTLPTIFLTCGSACADRAASKQEASMTTVELLGWVVMRVQGNSSRGERLQALREPTAISAG